MTALAIAATVLMLVLSATREPTPEARTPAELWAAVKPLGWKAGLIGGWRLITLLALIAGCLSILTLNVTQHVLHGATLAAVVITWKVCDLVDYHPVAVREARS
jgi:hypothetical protein